MKIDLNITLNFNLKSMSKKQNISSSSVNANNPIMDKCSLKKCSKNSTKINDNSICTDNSISTDNSSEMNMHGNNLTGKNINDISIIIDSILNNNLVTFDNKQQSLMFFISSKVLNNFCELLYKNHIEVSPEIVSKFIKDSCPKIIFEYSKNIKKRNRRVLSSDHQCMGRKIDGNQCTRRKKSGSEYCQSHQKRLPNGRYDQVSTSYKQQKTKEVESVR